MSTTPKCYWQNHCVGDPCQIKGDCEGELVCVNAKCAVKGSNVTYYPTSTTSLTSSKTTTSSTSSKTTISTSLTIIITKTIWNSYSISISDSTANLSPSSLTEPTTSPQETQIAVNNNAKEKNLDQDLSENSTIMSKINNSTLIVGLTLSLIIALILIVLFLILRKRMTWLKKKKNQQTTIQHNNATVFPKERKIELKTKKIKQPAQITTGEDLSHYALPIKLQFDSFDEHQLVSTYSQNICKQNLPHNNNKEYSDTYNNAVVKPYNDSQARFRSPTRTDF
ncbi:hypothetical protein HDU92_002644 [Lobulomyces angularis]|nr:hypothetical protein HDU92_002644 [Lobulomyces angularis]